MRSVAMSGRASRRGRIWCIAWATVGFEGGDGVPHALLGMAKGLGPQLFDGNEYANPIADFLDSHLLQNQLVTFDEITASHIIN